MPLIRFDDLPWAVIASAFWDPFWPSLSADVAGGLVTGLVVGIVLWRIDRNADTRTYGRGLARECDRFMFDLRNAFAMSSLDTFVVGSAVASASDAHDIAALVAKQPLDAYRDTLPQHAAMIESAQGLRRADAAFLTASSHLDAAVRRAVRTYHAGLDVIAANDPSRHAYIVGRIAEIPARDLVAWVDMPTNAVSALEEAFAAVSGDSQVVVTAPPFIAARDALITAARALEATL